MDIRSKVISAVRWSATARFLGQAFSWAITIVVIRLLSPGDYGLMAMAMVVVSLLILLNTLGLDAVLVQERDLDESLRRRVRFHLFGRRSAASPRLVHRNSPPADRSSGLGSGERR